MTNESAAQDPRDWIAAHVKLYLEDPEKAHLWDSASVGGPGVLPTLLLTTVGRRSGKPRHSPLIYAREGGGYVVVASKGGASSHPAWYHNLLGNPTCEIRVGEKRHHVRARTTQGDERSELWNVMAKLFPGYIGYKKRTDREIPVVVLELTVPD